MNANARRRMLAPRMLHAHPHDPPTQHRAAAGFGRMVAAGLFEAQEVLPDLVAAAVFAGYRGNVDGLRGRLKSTLNDAASDWSRRRDQVAWQVRKTIAPMFEEWAAPTAIRAEACRVNERCGAVLLPRDLCLILDEEAARALRGRRRRPLG